MEKTNITPQEKPVQNNTIQVMPGSFDLRMKVAERLAQSGLTGDLKTPAQVFLALQTGAELGLTPMASIRGIHVVKGKATLAADTMIGLIMSRADFMGIVREETENACKTTIKRKFHFGILEFIGEFSMSDAASAGLVKDDSGWKKYKRLMLQHRADAIAARKSFPDLFSGSYIPEEIDPAFNERMTTVEILEKAPTEKNEEKASETSEDIPTKEEIEDAISELKKYQELGISKEDIMATIKVVAKNRVTVNALTKTQISAVIEKIKKQAESKPTQEEEPGEKVAPPKF